MPHRKYAQFARLTSSGLPRRGDPGYEQCEAIFHELRKIIELEGKNLHFFRREPSRRLFWGLNALAQALLCDGVRIGVLHNHADKRGNSLIPAALDAARSLKVKRTAKMLSLAQKLCPPPAVVKRGSGAILEWLEDPGREKAIQKLEDLAETCEVFETGAIDISLALVKADPDAFFLNKRGRQQRSGHR